MIGLNLHQGRWRDRARTLATDVLRPRAEGFDRSGEFVRPNLVALFDWEFGKLCVPEEYGGAGFDLLALIVAVEELAQGCSSTTMCFVMHSSALPLIQAAGSEAQKSLLFPKVIKGQCLFSVAGSEPGSGSHIWHVDSYSERRGDAYSLEARKSFATSAGEADYYLVPTRTDIASGPDELTLFLVPGHNPCIRPGNPWDGLGLRGNASSSLHFAACSLQKEDKLGEEDAGNPLLLAFNLPVYLLSLASLYLGIAQRARDVAVAGLSRRIHSDTGGALSGRSVLQSRVAKMDCQLDSVRSYLYEAARGISHLTEVLFSLQLAGLLTTVMQKYDRADALLAVAKAKLMATDVAVSVVSDAFQMCGGSACRKGHEVERLYRDVRAGTVMAPDNDTLAELIGRRACSLPYPWQSPERGT